MLTIRPLEPFASQFFASNAPIMLAAGNVFGLVAALDRIAPGFAEVAELRAAFAVDGALWADWTMPLPVQAEVMVFPRVAGGAGDELSFRLLEPFGVEIIADLAQPLSAGEADHLRRLFDQHGLLLARGQRLSMERQRSLCALIGPVLEREGELGRMTNAGTGPSASALAWHADAAYTDHPFDALSLHAIDVVDGASGTRFVDAAAALGRIAPELRAQLADCTQQMISPHYTMIAARACDQRTPEVMVSAEMPAIRPHPRGGRACLWVSELQSAQLLGMDWEASRDLLHEVYAALYAPDAVFEHRWRTGDFVLWDNIALQHARGDLTDAGTRVLQRVIVGTEGAAPHVAAAKIRAA